MLLGFIAAVISVLTFHQGVVELYHLAGTAGRPWSMAPVAPLSVPRIVDLCFWGGLYGAVFGAALPWLKLPTWLAGIGLGILAALVGWFVVAPIKGNPIAAGWNPVSMSRSLLINGSFGLGVGLILPLLMPRRLGRRALRTG